VPASLTFRLALTVPVPVATSGCAQLMPDRGWPVRSFCHTTELSNAREFYDRSATVRRLFFANVRYPGGVPRRWHTGSAHGPAAGCLRDDCRRAYGTVAFWLALAGPPHSAVPARIAQGALRRGATGS